MNLNQRIEAFANLGQALGKGLWQPDISAAQASNPWFTQQNVQRAIRGIENLLDAGKLSTWTQAYQLDGLLPRQIGIIMAGNIPLVGFHDLLCVLMCGYHAHVKLSKKDPLLLPSLMGLLKDHSPELFQRVHFGNLDYKKLDALIATGSDNTARYVEFEFKSLPKIIRRNRTSHAIIHGNEDDDAFRKLGIDLFSYFGKGCRNVSKLWLPVDFDFERLKIWDDQGKELLETTAYAHNYQYQKALLSSLNQSFIDLGYALMQDHSAIVSPLAVVYYQHYQNTDHLNEILKPQAAKLQCLVSDDHWFPGSIDLGSAQMPEVEDYADNVDTLSFLESVN